MAAAGISVYHDRGGGETADLIKSQWPRRMNMSRPNEYMTTTNNYGVKVLCNVGQSYAPPPMHAGTSKRMGDWYEKTGVLQHRTEPGFRDTKAPSMLTEVPMQGYGTIRKPPRLVDAGSMVLSRATPSGLSNSQAVLPRRDDDVASRHSRQSSAAGSAGGMSRRSAAASSVSAAGHAAPPSWAQQGTAVARGTQPWRFDPLPMFERTNEQYGKTGTGMYNKSQAAGKSESGFLDPKDLIATLTRPRD